MQQTMLSRTKTQTTSTTSAPPRKGYALKGEADTVIPGDDRPLSPASTPASTTASIVPDLGFAIALLQLGEREGLRINQAAACDEWPATWSDDPQLKLIGEIAVEQPRPLCDALLLLLDGWYRHAHTLEAMQTEQRQQAQECQP